MNFKMHADLCTQLHELCVAKNKRYGDSFSKTVQHYGLISALTRMSDKWNRIETLILGRADESADESLVDSLIDLANYCIMTVCEIQDLGLKVKTSVTTSLMSLRLILYSFTVTASSFSLMPLAMDSASFRVPFHMVS